MPERGENVPYVIYRAAEETSVPVTASVAYGKYRFGVFQSHGAERACPHPEDSSVASRADGARDSYDVADSERPGKCHHDRRER